MKKIWHINKWPPKRLFGIIWDVEWCGPYNQPGCLEICVGIYGIGFVLYQTWEGGDKYGPKYSNPEDEDAPADLGSMTGMVKAAFGSEPMNPLVNESDINLKTDLKIERHEWPANMGTIGTMHELACKYCQSDLHPSKHCPELVKFPCILCGDITHNAFCCHNK